MLKSAQLVASSMCSERSALRKFGRRWPGHEASVDALRVPAGLRTGSGHRVRINETFDEVAMRNTTEEFDDTSACIPADINFDATAWRPVAA